MPLFTKFWSTKQDDSLVENANATPKPESYNHIPVHAARDARFQSSPSVWGSDRETIAKHHKRRSQMPQEDGTVLRINVYPSADKSSVHQRDVPYVSKKKQAPAAQRPTAILKELRHINAKRKIRTSRRAAHIEPIVDIHHRLRLPLTPLGQRMSVDVKSPGAPHILLLTKTQSPAPELDKILLGGDHNRKQHPEKESMEGSFTMGSRSSSFTGSSNSTASKSRKSSTSKSRKSSTSTSRKSSITSQESLYPPPSKNRARDSLYKKRTQASRFHNSESSRERLFRAAVHDSTGIEEAMACPDSFKPHRAPPSTVPNHLACSIPSIAGFDFGIEQPYSPDKLRPWLPDTKHDAFPEMPTADAI